MAAFAKEPASPYKTLKNGVIVADEQWTSQANDPGGHYTNTLRYSTDYGHTWQYPAYPTRNGTYNLCGPDTASSIRGDIFAVKYLGDADVGKVFISLSTSGIICSSDTGTEWLMASPSRESNNIPGAGPLYDVTFANGTFVAVGYGGLVKYIEGAPQGPPGKAWQTVYIGNLNLNSVTFGNGRFVAAGDHSTVWHSKNGQTWTQATLSGEADFYRIIFVQEANAGAGQFIAVATEATIWYSPDGVSWTEAAVLNGENADFRDVTYAAGKYVAVGDDNTISYSTDGILWQTDTSALFRDDDPYKIILIHPHAIMYDDASGLFIVVTADDFPFRQTGTIFYSSDGWTWANARIYGPNGNGTKQRVDEGYMATVINTDKGMFAIPFGSGDALADAPADILWSSPTPRALSGIEWTSLCGFNGSDCPQNKSNKK